MILTNGAHLVSTRSCEKLHRFAREIGLLREWSQDRRIPHYDLMGHKRRLAVRAGARKVPIRELVRRAIRQP